MKEFAQELVDRVIDTLHSTTPRDAIACGLVCRQWSYRSRQHLFSSVALSAESLPRFVTLAEESLLPVFSFVQILTFYIDSPLDDMLLEKLQSCSNLQAIRISHDFSYYPEFGAHLDSQLRVLHPHLQSLAGASPYITDLELRFSSPSLQTVLDVLACLPSIQSFRFTCFERTSTLPLPLPLQLRTLRIGGPTESMFSWLLTFPSLPFLTSLEIGPLSDHCNIEPMIEYLQRAGSAVESLRIDISGTGWDSVLSKIRTVLEHTPCLKNFTFTCYSPVQILDVLGALPEFDSSYAELKLESLTVILIRANRQLESVIEIDRALAEDEQRFRSLKRFSIRCVGQSVITEETRRTMPLADRRGILVVE